jgi:ornithine cyclodeaminase/alanine dehydrogenase-like protein (mu-crystallin family)
MSQNLLRFISGDDVKKSLQMTEAVEAMAQAFQELSKNKIVAPPRIHLDIQDEDGIALIMPVYGAAQKELTIKAITIFGNNPKHGLPLIHALVIIMDASNGSPLAIIDGSSLTAIRTGAASGLATKLLARESAETVAIFGAGLQGETQLGAVCAVRPIRKAWVFDPDKDKASKFACEMSKQLSIEIDVSTSPTDLQHADVICTATTSDKPVFDDANLKSGVHINAIGTFKPHVHEIPVETVVRARVVVDHLESCLVEAGDLIIPLNEGLITHDHILAEIGDIGAKIPVVRESESDITLFKTVGNAVQDLFAASLILKYARMNNLGIELKM